MNASEFLAAVASFLSSSRIDPDSGIIVAYSGGADSGALLGALSELGLKKLRAVHVMHNLRSDKEGELECSLVKDVCRSLNVPLTIARIRRGAIKSLAEKKRMGIEAAARAYRYHALESCAQRFGCQIIATAHTRDDQLETLLARVLYSTGMEGLGGIPPRRSLKHGLVLLRPLLFASRKDIEEYASGRALSWASDSSNADNRFLRNRIRNLLVPRLDADFSGWRTGLLGTSGKIYEDGKVVAAMVERVLATLSFDEATRSASMPLAAFRGLERPLKLRVLRHAIGRLCLSARVSGRALLDSVIALEEGADSLEVMGVRVVAGPEYISILRLLDFHTERGYFFLMPEAGVRKAGPVEITAAWAAADAGRKNFLLEGAFSFPLVVRSRKPGDSIVISGKSVKIDDLIRTWRLDGKTRRALPILEDQIGIVAVLPDALQGRQYLGKARFRDYTGRTDGRTLCLHIKGA